MVGCFHLSNGLPPFLWLLPHGSWCLKDKGLGRLSLRLQVRLRIRVSIWVTGRPVTCHRTVPVESIEPWCPKTVLNTASRDFISPVLVCTCSGPFHRVPTIWYCCCCGPCRSIVRVFDIEFRPATWRRQLELHKLHCLWKLHLEIPS